MPAWRALEMPASLAPCTDLSLFCTDRGRSSVVERQLPKLYVVGSIPIARSKIQRGFREPYWLMDDISPADWKAFKPLREAALERFCERVLDEVARINADRTKTKHERYLAIYRLMRERDKEINPIFDTLRRSTAVRQICSFRSHDLLTEDELRRFSPELVRRVEAIIEIFNRPFEYEAEGDPGSEHEK
jgi:hypothetical protein